MKQKTILVVEDEIELQEIIAEYLIEAGFAVLRVSDGMEALKHLERSNSAIDLIMTDISIPQISGIQLRDAARQQFSQIPFIFISGHGAETVLKNADAIESTYFLEKPFKMAELVDLARRITGLGH